MILDMPAVLGVFERLIHLRFVTHLDHAATVQQDPGLFDLLGRGPNLVRCRIQRQMHRLETDRVEPHALGHRQGLLEIEIAERVGSES